MAKQALLKMRDGLALHKQGRLSDAKAAYAEAVRLQPQLCDGWHLLSVVATQAHNHREALGFLEKAIALKPGHAPFHYERGVALHRMGRFEAAIASHDKAIALNPDDADAYAIRGYALQALYRSDAALASYDKAIAIRPDFVDAHINRAVALGDLMQWDAAVASCDTALALDPKNADAYATRGFHRQMLKQVDAAIADYRQAITLKPDHANGHLNLSTTLLLAGDYEAGWDLYEWRWRDKKAGVSPRLFQKPLWLGAEDLKGKTILLHGEQGLGDTLQFCRYAASIAALGARVVLEVQAPLAGVLTNLDGVSEVVAAGGALPEFDFHCPLMSLPLALKIGIPMQVPYIKADPAKVERWRAKLVTAPKVGLVWSGGFRADQPATWSTNARRNIPLQMFSIFKGQRFVSLQKGEPAETELKDLLHSGWDGPEILDVADDLKDFSETAALIANLDLVIAVDTSVAHLAGALGKPVWMMNRFDTCWRWLVDRDDTPWYPTMRIYRQQIPGDWGDVLRRVGDDLASQTAS